MSNLLEKFSWAQNALHRFVAMLKGVVEWVTITCRVCVPIALTFVGAWIDEYTILLKRLVDSKPSSWVVLWEQYEHPWKVIFLLIVLGVIIFQIIAEIVLFRRHRFSQSKINELQSKLTDQTNEIEEAKILKDNISSIVKLYLGAASKSLKMGTNERISFYILNPGEKSFSLVARNSENANFCIYIRDQFSSDEGIIGLAKATGYAFVSDLPDYDKAQKGYIKTCQKHFKGLTTATIKNLTMKARLYYAFRFSSHDHTDFNSVIVVESMNPKFATEQTLNDIFDSDKDFVYTLVKNFGKYMSTTDIAKRKEF